jgi:hypothetical protein
MAVPNATIQFFIRGQVLTSWLESPAWHENPTHESEGKSGYSVKRGTVGL